MPTNPEPYATLQDYLKERGRAATDGEVTAQQIWDAAYNAGIDCAKHALDKHIAHLGDGPKPTTRDERLVREAEISGLKSLSALMPLYRKVAKPT